MVYALRRRLENPKIRFQYDSSAAVYQAFEKHEPGLLVINAVAQHWLRPILATAVTVSTNYCKAMVLWALWVRPSCNCTIVQLTGSDKL